MAFTTYEENKRNLAQRIKEGLVDAEEWGSVPDYLPDDLRSYHPSLSILGSSLCYFCQESIHGARWRIFDRVDDIRLKTYLLHDRCYTSIKES